MDALAAIKAAGNAAFYCYKCFADRLELSDTERFVQRLKESPPDPVAAKVAPCFRLGCHIDDEPHSFAAAIEQFDAAWPAAMEHVNGASSLVYLDLHGLGQPSVFESAHLALRAICEIEHSRESVADEPPYRDPRWRLRISLLTGPLFYAFRGEGRLATWRLRESTNYANPIAAELAGLAGRSKATPTLRSYLDQLALDAVNGPAFNAQEFAELRAICGKADAPFDFVCWWIGDNWARLSLRHDAKFIRVLALWATDNPFVFHRANYLEYVTVAGRRANAIALAEIVERGHFRPKLTQPVLSTDRPQWDIETRELHFGGALVRAFVRSAPSQETILAAFQEEQWAPRIDNPLPDRRGATGSDRARDAVQHLNESQTVIRFTMDGTGDGIAWSDRRPAKPKKESPQLRHTSGKRRRKSGS